MTVCPGPQGCCKTPPPCNQITLVIVGCTPVPVGTNVAVYQSQGGTQIFVGTTDAKGQVTFISPDTTQASPTVTYWVTADTSKLSDRFQDIAQNVMVSCLKPTNVLIPFNDGYACSSATSCLIPMKLKLTCTFANDGTCTLTSPAGRSGSWIGNVTVNNNTYQVTWGGGGATIQITGPAIPSANFQNIGHFCLAAGASFTCPPSFSYTVQKWGPNAPPGINPGPGTYCDTVFGVTTITE